MTNETLEKFRVCRNAQTRLSFMVAELLIRVNYENARTVQTSVDREWNGMDWEFVAGTMSSSG